MADTQWKLQDHEDFPKNNIVAVVVLDGWGESKPDEYNCIHVADTPTTDSLKKVLFFLMISQIYAVLVTSDTRCIDLEPYPILYLPITFPFTLYCFGLNVSCH